MISFVMDPGKVMWEMRKQREWDEMVKKMSQDNKENSEKSSGESTGGAVDRALNTGGKIIRTLEDLWYTCGPRY